MTQIGSDNRKLHQKSRLHFHYDKGNGHRAIVRLPFFENILVEETKSARWKKFQVVSRSSDLYAYLGADSRKLSLTFSMTLPHIQDLIDNIGTASYIDYDVSPEDPKGEFQKPTPPKTIDNAFNDAVKSNSEEATFQELIDGKPLYNTEAAFSTSLPPSEGAGLGWPFILPTESTVNDTINNIEKTVSFNSNKLIDTVVFWINTIRSCVSNNAKDTSLGPPIIRLTHGVMFNDVPCIATSVSITSDPLAGFDNKTLLPRKIDVTMSLEEFRMGDLGDYNPGTYMERDNLAGWEAVLSHGTMDPKKIK
jgi:hypothetical protein